MDATPLSAGCVNEMEAGGDEEGEAREETKECQRLTAERDEAERQLKHIKRGLCVIQKGELLSSIWEVLDLRLGKQLSRTSSLGRLNLRTAALLPILRIYLEREKKLNCENRKLTYLSLSSRPCLDELLPSISDCISQEEETDTREPGSDPFSQYKQQVKDLQETVSSLLEEKKQLTCQLQNQQRQIEELTALTEKEQAEMKELYKTIEQQSKTIKRFNRVSMMATHEYENMKEQLDLEQSLRQKAETYAHEMMVKQKEANRQSMILLQQGDPSIQLIKALEDVASVTKTLEEERIQHQEKVKALEAELDECALRKQLVQLQRQLEILDEEKKETEGRLQEEEKRNTLLEQKVKELQEERRSCASASSPSPGTAPPPAPPPSLIAIMRKSSKGGKGTPKLEQAPVNEAVDEVKVKAVNEMMERIKHGVVLRPVKSQDTKQPSPVAAAAAAAAVEEKHQGSAMEELKGILETVKKSPSRGFQEVVHAKKDSELEVILRRRRKQACDPDTEDDGQLSKVSSSNSLNGRHSSDSGKDTEGPGSSSLSGSERGSRTSSDSGREPAVARQSSDSGMESKGAAQSENVCRSLSEKEPAEPVTNGCCSGEMKDGDPEKWAGPNGIGYMDASNVLQTTISSSAQSPNAANSSTDAEC
ncbi:shootin-1-like [Sinocyclocheilus rhinocerous]|uniref:shootin-1-like n=1 Tax=Sinocyclocheilus rhinocerous TaxID=307959 RepID=UPI0007BA0470|nr:PREDICTED: shootin-1-like [Sinocyclocheilus rhinocerous]